MAKNPKAGRSIVTNGNRLFMTKLKDGPEFRRFRDLLAAIEAERGGRGAMSIVQQEAARQYVALTVAMEGLHADLAAGKPVDLEAMGQLGDRADRQARAMGKPKTTKPPGILERRLARQGGTA